MPAEIGSPNACPTSTLAYQFGRIAERIADGVVANSLWMPWSRTGWAHVVSRGCLRRAVNK